MTSCSNEAYPDLQRADQVESWIRQELPQRFADYCLSIIVDEKRLDINSENRGGAQFFGCVQDIFLSSLVLELEESGKLGLCETVGEHLAELKAGTKAAANVRIGDLLCHASGLQPPEYGQTAARAHGSWSSLVDYLTTKPARFPPGTTADSSFLERSILIEILKRSFGLDPYGEVHRRYFSGSSVRIEASSFFGLCDIYSDTAALLDATAKLRKLMPRMLDRVKEKPNPGSIEIYEMNHKCKRLIPLTFGLGLIGFGDRYWGQVGTSSDGAFAVRFSEDDRFIIACGSSIQRSRDMILNQLSAAFGNLPTTDFHSVLMGNLAGFDPAELIGTYDYGKWGKASIDFNGSHLDIAVQNSDNRMRYKVMEDGYLAGRFSWPGVWLVPFRHPGDGRTCLMHGQIPLVMTSDC